jgi:hypothetical protein
MADYSLNKRDREPTRYDYEVETARKDGYAQGYAAGYEAGVLSLAKSATPNSPPRCRACQAYIWEEQTHACSGTRVANA